MPDRGRVPGPADALFESGKREAHANHLAAIRRALEDAGVEILAATEQRGPGVSLREPN